MSFHKNSFRFLRALALSIAGWGALALMFSAQLVGLTSMPWSAALRMEAGQRLAWAIATPLLFFLTEWLPLERKTWRRAVPVHLLAGIATLALVVAGQRLAMGFGPVVSAGFHPNGGVSISLSGSAPPGPVPNIHMTAGYDGGADGPRILQFQARMPDGPDGTPPGVAGGPPPHLRPPGKFGSGFFLIMGLPMNLPILLVILAAAHAFHFYKLGQERSRQALELAGSLAQARLDALKMQIRPHFLFNALNSVTALVHKNPEAADEMIGALSEFLRCTLVNDAAHEVPLCKEIEFVRRYLAIELVRFSDRLRCEYSVPDETSGALVPMLVLQPLVENAVRHGLEGAPGEVRISVHAERRETELLLSITNNGPSPSPALREGIGLSNTRARLRELYGASARMEIRGSDGFTVELWIPFHVA